MSGKNVCRCVGRQAARSVLLLVSALIAVSAGAIGPDLPLVFIEPSRDQWTLTVHADPKLVTNVRVEQELYERGALKERRAPRIKAQTTKEGAQSLDVKLQWPSFRSLEPGTYAQKVIARGDWRIEGNNTPLSIERWIYFVVERGKQPQRIDAEEYERRADPVQEAGDVQASARAYIGASETADMPLQQTTSTKAISVDSRGGIAEEQPPHLPPVDKAQARYRAVENRDLSERDER